MYMIIININANKFALRENYLDVCNEVRDIMHNEGFTWRGGSLYEGNEYKDAVCCVLAAQKLAKKLPFIKDVISNIQMLRVEEITDLEVCFRHIDNHHNK